MTTYGRPPDTARKVPVWRTAVESYRFVFANLDRFFALGWLPLLIIFATNMATDVLIDVENASVVEWVAFTGLGAPSKAMYAVFAVRWHRFFLHDDRKSVFSEILAARNWRFLGYLLLLTFAPFVPVAVIFLNLSGTILSGGTIKFLHAILLGIVGLVLLSVMLRFSLVFPSTAIDRPLGLGEAWRELKGNSWRYIGTIIIVIVVPYNIVGIIVSLTEMSSVARTPINLENGIFTFLITVFNFLMMAAGITVLSKFYRHIIYGETGEGGAAAAP